ncbi:hypothetical protein [Photobacterium frigidiphilum]|uniref:hypothetical protein n=1 Tax=Photobacterium frigidiphilum TaxID=264736 RepID=UPI001472A903|nr:hypothetical protein [Photobacterium frigidiphilum]
MGALTPIQRQYQPVTVQMIEHPAAFLSGVLLGIVAGNRPYHEPFAFWVATMT